MVAAAIIQERGSPAPPWAKISGLYADLSGWPDRPAQYYVKCPKCGQVHGSYSSLRQAHSKRLCQGCDLETVNKLKDEIAQVDDPGHKLKPISKIIGEAEELLPDEPGFNPRDELLSLGGSWIINAKLELEQREGVSLKFKESDEDDLHSDPEAVDTFELEDENPQSYRSYTVYKTDEVAEQAAFERVKQDLEDSPENFSANWLQHYIDEDELRRAIGDPYEDWEGELEGKDTPEIIEFLVGEGKLDEETFYTKTGKIRKITRATQELLDAAIEEYKEESKPKFDPWEWMEEMHGSGEGRESYGLTPNQRKEIRMANAVKAAMNLVRIDYDRAAQDAVRADGWAHFMSSYDGNYIQLEDDVVAVRNN